MISFSKKCLVKTEVASEKSKSNSYVKAPFVAMSLKIFE